METTCEVIRKGALTTVQDLGRWSHMRFGVSRCGAMDSFSLRIGNLLAGNVDERLAALEATLVGPRLRAHGRVGIALTGADLSPKIDDRPVPMWQFLVLDKGSVLSFGPPKSGCRSYVCFTGGIRLPTVLGSRSTHTRAAIGGIDRALQSGDLIPVQALQGDVGRLLECNVLSMPLRPEIAAVCQVDVLIGPQAEQFTADSVHAFLDGEYTVTPHSDRMGYRLTGPKLVRYDDGELITEATPPGSIQVPHDGMPIVLMPDAAVTGGYPKVAIATSPSLDRLAQLRPGDRLRFRSTTLGSAHDAIRDRERTIDLVRDRFESATQMFAVP